MQQIIYTSCVQGRSVSGRGGFGVRASSPGVAQELVQQALKLSGYQRPPGAEATNTDLPVKLAFTPHFPAGGLLCHSVNAGLDPMTSRPGNFFAHILLGEGITHPAEALQAWKSPFWKKTDAEGSTELPECHFEKQIQQGIGTGTPLDLDGLPESVVTLAGWLVARILDEGFQKVIVAADPDPFIESLRLVFSYLPLSLSKTISFSTYEKSPMLVEFKIVAVQTESADPSSVESFLRQYPCPTYHFETGKTDTRETGGPGGALVAAFEKGQLKELLLRAEVLQNVQLKQPAEFQSALGILGGDFDDNCNLAPFVGDPGMRKIVSGRSGIGRVLGANLKSGTLDPSSPALGETLRMISETELTSLADHLFDYAEKALGSGTAAVLKRCLDGLMLVHRREAVQSWLGGKTALAAGINPDCLIEVSRVLPAASTMRSEWLEEAPPGTFAALIQSGATSAPAISREEALEVMASQLVRLDGTPLPDSLLRLHDAHRDLFLDGLYLALEREPALGFQAGLCSSPGGELTPERILKWIARQHDQDQVIQSLLSLDSSLSEPILLGIGARSIGVISESTVTALEQAFRPEKSRIPMKKAGSAKKIERILADLSRQFSPPEPGSVPASERLQFDLGKERDPKRPDIAAQFREFLEHHDSSLVQISFVHQLLESLNSRTSWEAVDRVLRQSDLLEFLEPETGNKHGDTRAKAHQQSLLPGHELLLNYSRTLVKRSTYQLALKKVIVGLLPAVATHQSGRHTGFESFLKEFFTRLPQKQRDLMKKEVANNLKRDPKARKILKRALKHGGSKPFLSEIVSKFFRRP